ELRVSGCFPRTSRSGGGSRTRETHHPAELLVPEFHAGAGQTVPQTHAHGGPERRHAFMRRAQVVVRNARCQVMDVVIADVAGEPAQHWRQVVEGAAVDRGGARIPMVATYPVALLETVLYVVQPDTHCA